MLQNKIQELRRENNFSQREMAERIKVSRQTISKWECGMAVPDADYLAAIADLFSVDVNYLLAKDSDTNAAIDSTANAASAMATASEDALVNKMDDVTRKAEKLDIQLSDKGSSDFDWDNLAQQLEQYNAIHSQRLNLIKATIKWVLILLACFCVLVFAYKIYKLHFFAIKSAEQVPIETMRSVDP